MPREGISYVAIFDGECAARLIGLAPGARVTVQSLCAVCMYPGTGYSYNSSAGTYYTWYLSGRKCTDRLLFILLTKTVLTFSSRAVHKYTGILLL